MTIIAAIPALRAAGKVLGVNDTVLVDRAQRIARTIAGKAEISAEKAVEQLGQLTLRELFTVLAQGPDEQARALLAPDQVPAPPAVPEAAPE